MVEMDKPIAHLVPIQERQSRQIGIAKDKLKIPKDFFEPLSEEALKAWNLNL